MFSDGNSEVASWEFSRPLVRRRAWPDLWYDWVRMVLHPALRFNCGPTSSSRWDCRWWTNSQTQTSLQVDKFGRDGIYDVLRVQDLAANACYGLVEKSLEAYARVSFGLREGVTATQFQAGFGHVRPFRIFVRCILEQVLQLMNQSAVLALTAGKDSWADGPVVASITFSLLMLLLKIGKAMENEDDIFRWIKLPCFCALLPSLIGLLPPNGPDLLPMAMWSASNI